MYYHVPSRQIAHLHNKLNVHYTKIEMPYKGSISHVVAKINKKQLGGVMLHSYALKNMIYLTIYLQVNAALFCPSPAELAGVT